MQILQFFTSILDESLCFDVHQNIVHFIVFEQIWNIATRQ
jgi:hypothetical protein